VSAGKKPGKLVLVKDTPPLSVRIRTERLLLRPLQTGDAGRLRSVLRRNALHLAPWQPSSVPGADTLAHAADLLVRDRALWRADRQYAFFGFLDGVDLPIVRISLSGIHRGGYQGGYLGYWVDVDYLGRGFAIESVNAMLQFAFGPLHLHRVQAAVMPRNEPSVKVLKHTGFRREGLARKYLCIAGIWEDHELFARVLEDGPL
jgi:[ribosomal protein S5]-alanine N-acetyltransferase